MKAATSLQFFHLLRWIDGRPLLDTMEAYRRRLFTQVLDTYRDDGTPSCNFVLAGRAKKNNKTTDLVLASLYCLNMRESPQGSDCYILANDEDQAGDDLDLAKKIIAASPVLASELDVYNKEVRRLDGRGTLKILPARDAAGAHGKTAVFVGFDEIHAYRHYDLFEALAPDPTRTDTLTWISSYDTIYNAPGIPLFDFKKIGIEGSDPRMVFSWYSADHCTDPAFAELAPELRANPSMASWPEGRAYLTQQKRRLPSNKFRRLHLNLPGSPTGAFLDQGAVIDATVDGRRSLPPQDGVAYSGFVDMSGGSSDDATLSIAHKDGTTAVVDLVASQAGRPPFNPRDAVRKFADLLKQYRLASVTGDAYAGETFKRDFADHGISYTPSKLSKSDLYEAFEPKLNAREVQLPDVPKMQEQLLTLVMSAGGKVDHQKGGHDDWANAVAGAVWCATSGRRPMVISDAVMAEVNRHALTQSYGRSIGVLNPFPRTF